MWVMFFHLTTDITGVAADIVELFESFREGKVMLRPSLTYPILAVWSWSLLQFSLILGGDNRVSSATKR